MHLIVVKPGGVIRTLYTDRLPLNRMFPGQETTRASNVEWDPARQGWTVELADGTRLDGCWPIRAAALAAEEEAVNARL